MLGNDDIGKGAIMVELGGDVKRDSMLAPLIRRLTRSKTLPLRDLALRSPLRVPTSGTDVTSAPPSYAGTAPARPLDD